MTDQERFLDLIRLFELTAIQGQEKRRGVKVNLIQIKKDYRNPKQNGYFGFYCAWFFDESGKFLDMGIWE